MIHFNAVLRISSKLVCFLQGINCITAEINYINNWYSAPMFDVRYEHLLKSVRCCRFFLSVTVAIGKGTKFLGANNCTIMQPQVVKATLTTIQNTNIFFLFSLRGLCLIYQKHAVVFYRRAKDTSAMDAHRFSHVFTLTCYVSCNTYLDQHRDVTRIRIQDSRNFVLPEG